MLMKNERCLIKKSLKMMKKTIKMSCLFIGLIFLMGFYDERNIYVDLEEMTVELGDTLNNDKIDYINSYLSIIENKFDKTTVNNKKVFLKHFFHYLDNSFIFFNLTLHNII